MHVGSDARNSGIRSERPLLSIPLMPSSQGRRRKEVGFHGASQEANRAACLKLLQVTGSAALPPGLLLAPVDELLTVQGPVGLTRVDAEVELPALQVLGVHRGPLEAGQRNGPERRGDGADAGHSRARGRRPRCPVPLVPALEERGRQDVGAQGGRDEAGGAARGDLLQVGGARALPSQLPPAPVQEEAAVDGPVRRAAVDAELGLPALHVERVQGPPPEADEQEAAERGLALLALRHAAAPPRDGEPGVRLEGAGKVVGRLLVPAKLQLGQAAAR
mmetsp:Transcript_50300/g.145879  ORF Transcript_50300/g.145879 Transcript_50300/m.145879 type:complete len:276 (-) Transcript_50300:259-1086(-)